MPNEFSHAFAWVDVPHVGCPVETAGDYLVPEWVVECQCVYHIFMSEESVDLGAIVGVLQLAGSIIGTSYESGTIFIKTNIWKR